VGERGGEYRRRLPEGTVLYEAVRDNLATLLAEASEVGRGMPRYVDLTPFLGRRGAESGATTAHHSATALMDRMQDDQP
jgi:hypothetical protein